MEGRRGSKRRNEDQEAARPHDILWFHDGNVVLATDIYLFKVYKGLLALHSSVFRDMFELPNVGESISGESSGGIAQEMYEGVPLISLIGDNGEDVAHLLRAVFERHYYHRDDKDTPLDVITALLVLSSKYDFKELLKDVVIQISQHYPMSLQEFDQVTEDDVPIFGRERSDCELPLLKAAFKAGVDALLPILFFSSTFRDVSSIFRESDSMSPECLHYLMKGKEQLDIKVHQLISDLPEYLRKGVGSSDCQCSEAKTCFRKAQYTNLSALINSYFYQTRGPVVVAGYLSPICEHCGASVAKSIDEKRDEIWKEIPSYFCFPGWEATKARLDELINS